MKTRSKSQKASVRQQEIFQYIKAFLLEKGYPPSVREIGKAVGLQSSSTVHGYLNQLERRGLIKRDPTKPRAIDILTEKPWGTNVPVPLVKTVTTDPIFSDKHLDNKVYSFPEELLGTKEKTFMIKMKDMSMIKLDILAGDLLFVHEQHDFNDGDIVLVLAKDEADDGPKAECAPLVRRISHTEDGRITLQPENDGFETLYVEEPQVIGKIIGIYRQL